MILIVFEPWTRHQQVPFSEDANPALAFALDFHDLQTLPSRQTKFCIVDGTEIESATTLRLSVIPVQYVNVFQDFDRDRQLDGPRHLRERHLMRPHPCHCRDDRSPSHCASILRHAGMDRLRSSPPNNSVVGVGIRDRITIRAKIRPSSPASKNASRNALPPRPTARPRARKARQLGEILRAGRERVALVGGVVQAGGEDDAADREPRGQHDRANEIKARAATRISGQSRRGHSPGGADHRDRSASAAADREPSHARRPGRGPSVHTDHRTDRWEQ
jgi:hypothetical protein